MWRWSAIALCLASSIVALAQERCTPQQAKQAEKAVDSLNSWDRIHDWYKAYSQCDDGGQAEGMSEAVARNLVDRWERLSRLGELIKDAGFRRFILKHVDATLNADDLEKIAVNAEKRCPTNLRALCRELKIRAEAP